MSERRQQFALGLFVFLALFLMGGLIIIFGSGERWFKKSNSYTIVFSDAPGISTGSPVRRSGVKVGSVSSIDLDNETGLVRVAIQLDTKFTPRTSEEPVISKGLITGDTSIDFMPKAGERSEQSQMIPPGSTIVGVAPFNARQLFTSATDIVPEAQKSMEQLRRTFEKVDQLMPEFQKTVREFGELARSGREFIPELRKTNDAIRDFFAGDDEPVPAAPAAHEAPSLLGKGLGLGSPEAPALQAKGGPHAVAYQAPEKLPVQPRVQKDLKNTLKELKDLGPEIKRTTQDVRYFLRTATFWTDEIGVLLLKTQPRVEKAIDAFTGTMESVNKTLSPENQKSITATLKNVENASGKLDRLANEAEGLMKDGKTTLKNLNGTMAKADLALDDFRKVTKPLAESMPKLIRNIEIGSEQFTQAVSNVNELIKAVGKAEGTFQKFIADPALYNNLNGIACSVNKLVGQLEPILRDVGVFADKIARHPESLGIRGAVAPGSGLKEAPPSSGFQPRNP